MKSIRELLEEQETARLAVLERLLEKGVVVFDLSSVYIDPEAEIAPGVQIHANNHVRGRTVIGAGTVLQPNNIITDCEIGCGCNITASVLESAKLGDRTTVGPFAYLRPGSEAGEACRIGDFVELKNARLGRGTKVSHLTYVGDAELGPECNVGCGVVFANYDGEKKQKSTVGRECFLGSNCNIVAPVRIGDGAYVAAGTTVTKDVEADSFVIGRVRQEKLNLRGKYKRRDISEEK